MRWKWFIGVWVPMIVGGFIGWAIARYLGLGGALGMVAGAGVWLAYEMRENTRRMRIDIEIMQRDLAMMRKEWP